MFMYVQCTYTYMFVCISSRFPGLYIDICMYIERPTTSFPVSMSSFFKVPG